MNREMFHINTRTCVDPGVCVCVVVSEVVSPDSADTVAPPVVISPIASTSTHEGEPARFQCRVRGDGKKKKVSLKAAIIHILILTTYEGTTREQCVGVSGRELSAESAASLGFSAH